ncbi:FAD-dependent oxidoreductase [Yinghuangia aomiensis]
MPELTSVVVVGGGAAGVSAVEALRREGYRTADPGRRRAEYSPYDRPPLSKQVLTGQWDVERTWLRAVEHYRDLDVALVQARAAALDPVGRRLSLDVGTELPFDGAVLAPGLRARRLPDGHHLTGVHVLRDPAGTRTPAAAHRVPRRRPHRGGRREGFLGLEVRLVRPARSASRPAVVDPARQPMLRRLGPRLLARLVARPAPERTASACTSAAGVAEPLRLPPAGHGRGQALTDGTVLPRGLRARRDRRDRFRGGHGWRTPGCRSATASSATVLPGRARHPPRATRPRGSTRGTGAGCGWSTARTPAEQGRLRYNLLHGPVKPFAPLPYFWTDQVGVKIQAYGLLSEDSDVSVEFGSPDEGRFVAAYRAGGRLTGRGRLERARAVAAVPQGTAAPGAGPGGGA